MSNQTAINEATDIQKPDGEPLGLSDLLGRVRDCLHGFAELYDAEDARRLVQEVDDSGLLVEIKCVSCGGNGVVDSGGFTPWGKAIDVPCPDCA